MSDLSNKRIITVATTGAWPQKSNNPNLPTQPDEIAEEIYSCWKEGAAIAHIHIRNKEDKDSQGKVLRKERFSGSYSRSFYVGNNISQEDIKASFDNGELTILIPKNAPAKVEENHFIPIE